MKGSDLLCLAECQQHKGDQETLSSKEVSATINILSLEYRAYNLDKTR